MKKLFWLLPVAFFAANLHAQQKEYVFKNFTQEEGLPSNETYKVFEDSRHYIWIATDLGVVRYNGNKFEQFNLPDNVIFKIREDGKGRIWFFSHKALLAYFENEKMQLYKYNGRIAKHIQKVNIVDAYVDNSDNIFLSSSLDSNYIIHADGKIEAYLGIASTMRQTEIAIKEVGNKRYLSTVEKATFGGMQAAMPTLFSVSTNGNTQKFLIPITARPFSQFGSVGDNEGNIYFFGDRQLIKLKKEGAWQLTVMPERILSLKVIGQDIIVGLQKNGAVPLSCSNLEKAGDTILPGKSITSVCAGYEGGLWFSTLENGVFFAKSTNITRITQPLQTNQFISGMLNLHDSILVYAKSDGFYTYSGKKSKFFFPLQNLPPSTLFTDSSKTLYFVGGGREAATVHPYKDNNFRNVLEITSPSEPVRISRDSFVISRSNCIIRYKSSYTSGGFKLTGYDENYHFNIKQIFFKPGKIFLDSKKKLWCGTNDGLYRSDDAIDTLTKILDSSALLANGISCLRELSNGVIAAGIRGNGIALLNGSLIIATITEKDGLASNKIKYLLPLKNSLWVATAKGISVIRFSSLNPVSYTVTNIGKEQGFYNIIINQLMPFQQKIVAATSNGLYFIENPDIFFNRETTTLPFYIKTVSYYKGDTTNISGISLPYSKNRLAIKYTAVSFNGYENIKYIFRLGNGDTIWHTTTNTELLLENMEPGRYNIELQAIMPNAGRASEIKRLTVAIEKPWWQNNWLRLLAAMLISGIVYRLVKNRIRKVKAEAKRKTDFNAKLAELEQTALRAQMNPHFIFNCLTSIQQLIISGNKTDASEYLVKFSRLIRKTLDMSARPFIPISEEKEYLEEYLSLEQLRLAGQFDFTISTHDSIDIQHTLIPNMMIQPVVENSVRHGIKPLEGRHGNIAVVFSQEPHSIVCAISDNGIGRSSISSFSETSFTKHKSYGMEIIRKRLEIFSEFNGGESGIDIEDLYDAAGNPCGMKVTLQLPYKKTI